MLSAARTGLFPAGTPTCACRGVSYVCNLAVVRDHCTWGAAPSEASAAVGSAAPLQAGELTWWEHSVTSSLPDFLKEREVKDSLDLGIWFSKSCPGFVLGSALPCSMAQDVPRHGAETFVHPTAFGDDGAFPVLGETARQEDTCDNIVLPFPIFGGSHKPAFSLSRLRGVPPIYQASALFPLPRACQVSASSRQGCYRRQLPAPLLSASAASAVISYLSLAFHWSVN